MGKQIVYESITIPPVIAHVAGIVYFDTQHRYPVARATYEEVHMLLANVIESGQSVSVLNKICQPRFANDVHPSAGNRLENLEKALFNRAK